MYNVYNLWLLCIRENYQNNCYELNRITRSKHTVMRNIILFVLQAKSHVKIIH